MESTRTRLIALLEEQADDYISGQQLSDQLHISRTAVWKHMKELEKDGYEIEAVSRKGYRIVSSPDKVSLNTLQWGLKTEWVGKQLIHHRQIDSTQRMGHELAKQHYPHGTVIIADEQLEGKGRMERNWYSPQGEGIWMSFLLRPELPPVHAPQLTLLAAAAVAEVLAETCQVTPQIKWPNDVLIDHKKMAGILTEMQAEHDHIQYVVLGMGINMNQPADSLAEDIHYKATSLLIETGETWSLQFVTQALLEKFEQLYDLYMREGFPPIKSKWEAYGYRIGERVSISTMQEKWEGKLLNIEPDGALNAEGPDGEEKKLYSAEIHWGKGGYYA
ncbi:biotin--[acetyl-CoA-carboxylase] ligase [Thalassobacillus sp. CUG 92003]|uniref:biotin--[acetyl-CoA-carboxylase] ligase n=1 Tax=Thalassobacillus sp. CUG 92003 TaxID=2736641 RepID=UPI0015E62C14|nr:biotin--[acetyl-CoA-carboxylase] ligase [Thalassobacillus sp. CUG 92003]